jgi:hypothetical protein
MREDIPAFAIRLGSPILFPVMRILALRIFRCGNLGSACLKKLSFMSTILGGMLGPSRAVGVFDSPNGRPGTCFVTTSTAST